MKGLLKSRLFWFGLVIRVLALPFFGSSYLRDLFIPFLDAAVTHPGTNPWSLLPPSHFPYGSFLFALLYGPRQLAYWAFGRSMLGTSAAGIALCKLPLLGVELCLLLVMMRRTLNARGLLLNFWLNPVLFYITYVHGQLDAVVTTATVLSVLLLIEGRLKWSAFAMGCALAAKFSAAVAVPLVLTYLWRREFPHVARRKMAVWLGVFATTDAFGFFPIVSAGHIGYTSIGSPEALRVIAAKIDLGGGLVLDISAALVLVLLGRLCLSTRLSATGLLYSVGFIFALLVATTHAMPGWYYWPLPFLCMLYANHDQVSKVPWYVTHAAYILHFLLLPELDLTAVLSPQEAANASFTLLQTGMFSLLAVFWFVALKGEATLERLIKPLMIGIAGDSATGKNRLSHTLMLLFGAKHCEMLEGDDYHRWERGDDRYLRYTHLSPRANHLRMLHKHTRRLTAGRPVEQRQYDHGTGRFAALRQIRSQRMILVQGLHTFYLRNMRQAFDLKIFLEADPLVQLAWKLGRDVGERGHSREKVLASLELRRIDALQHIKPQRRYADWIIQAVSTGEVDQDAVLNGAMPVIVLRHILWNDVDLDDFLAIISSSGGVRWSLEREGNDLDRTALVLAGSPSKDDVAALAHRLFPYLRPITRSPQAPQWLPGQDGLMQLLALNLLSGGRQAAEEESRFGTDQAPGEHGRRPHEFADVMGSGSRHTLPDPSDEELASGA